ncbi:hypothetical protein R6Q57_005516 [Mikania cordata]
MEKLELFFIPSPLMGHVGQAVELARLFIKRFHHLTITVLVMKLPSDPIGTDYIDSFTEDDRIKFIHFPSMDLDLFQDCPTVGFMNDAVINCHKPIIRELVASRLTRFNESGSSFDPVNRLGALVVDMFCTPVIDVAKELNVPTYVFFTSNAAFLGNKDQWSKRFIGYTRKYRLAKGIIVNTFLELEQQALVSFDDKTPPVYPVGPLLKPEKPTPNDEVLQWLHDQPKSSVLLLCFGSRGWFEPDQVRELAVAIERSGYRFIWSLRRPPDGDQKGFPSEYADYNEVLPGGFLERTAGKGKVLGGSHRQKCWLPWQPGGSYRTAGGTPYSRASVEISLDYNQMNKNQKVVSAEEIERGIREVMDRDSAVRAKVKKMKAMARMALEEDGSSFASLSRLVDDIM